MKSSYALGLFYIFTVSIIWSAASILVQYLYEGLDFDSPFLLTYIGTSLFIILIPAYYIFENGWKFQNYSSCCDSCGTRGNNKDQYESPLEQQNTSSEGTPLSHHLDECFDDSLDDIDPQYGLQEELQLEERNSENHAFPDEGHSDYQNNDHHYFLSQMEHLKMAAKIAPWWFVSNYFYNLSLKYTTITSSTVLASTGSVFTFIFSLVWGDESFNNSKFFGVILAFVGSFITSLHDANTSSNRFLNGTNPEQFPYQLWGDIAGLISAIGYGVYTVLIRVLCHDESIMSMNLFLGYVGLLNMVALSPIAWWSITKLNASGGTDIGGYDESSSGGNGLSAEHLTWFVLLCVVIKGLFDNVLSDYLWARSIVLTSATVATVGLGLTIPLALISDLFVMNRGDVWTLQSVGGATLVLSGFIFVNLGEEGKDDPDDMLIDSTHDELEISMTLNSHTEVKSNT